MTRPRLFRRFLLWGFRLVYAAGQRVRRRLTTAGQVVLGAALTAGALGVDTRQSLAFQIFAFGMALLVTGYLLLYLQRGRFAVERRLPPLATMARPFTYRIRVHARTRPLDADSRILDELAPSFPSVDDFHRPGQTSDVRRNWFDRKVGYPRFVGLVRQGTGAAIPEVAAAAAAGTAEAEVRVTATPLRRGFLEFRQIVVARPDPLGLVRSLHTTPAAGRLLVLPRRYDVPRLELSGTRQEQPGGVAFSGHVGESEEFVATREYQPGDPLRRIHWRGWARVGHPVVREYQDEFFVRHALVLDTFTMAATSAFEEAISIAASYVINLPGTDSLLDLVFVGDRPHRLTAGRGTGGEQHLLETLACIEPAGSQGFEALANALIAHAGRVTGMVLIFIHWDEARHNLVRNLLALGTRVVVFVVSAATTIEPGPLGHRPGSLWHLHPGQVQDDLDRGPERTTGDQP